MIIYNIIFILAVIPNLLFNIIVPHFTLKQQHVKKNIPSK